ncbi:hypothetical protein F5X96DRAFT_87246 [Biscogniauxia mediterranea]|nr:hypothetical protein F5X96DRAFT_87246 [Biscogniauxia mediterranea]
MSTRFGFSRRGVAEGRAECRGPFTALLHPPLSLSLSLCLSISMPTSGFACQPILPVALPDRGQSSPGVRSWPCAENQGYLPDTAGPTELCAPPPPPPPRVTVGFKTSAGRRRSYRISSRNGSQEKGKRGGVEEEEEEDRGRRREVVKITWSATYRYSQRGTVDLT